MAFGTIKVPNGIYFWTMQTKSNPKRNIEPTRHRARFRSLNVHNLSMNYSKKKWHWDRRDRDRESERGRENATTHTQKKTPTQTNETRNGHKMYRHC